MDEVKMDLDRYDGRLLAERLCREAFVVDGREASFQGPLGDDDEFCVIFEIEDETFDDALLDTTRSLLRSIGELDNQVQAACARECKRTGLHPRNFESMLAYVWVYPTRAVLHYFGTGVNTEWEEKVRFEGGEWVYPG